MALAAGTVATGDCGCGIGRWEARWLDLYRLAAAGATSADPARHGCGRGNDKRMRAGGMAAPPPSLIGGGHDVGGSGTARLRAPRQRATTDRRLGGRSIRAAAPSPTRFDLAWILHG
ncbi:hypothetical protein OsJ_21371 [Oryza sativa Japonica Group]|uniref:Uncharacterized protein n=1 Tax=Oryza sativa subsp. japonica TaxID=39947 RepID=A3BBT8_ORYSJ|nr:hypothetical protein OsJ_21371 [Oryza sativa Japonica Group]